MLLSFSLIDFLTPSQCLCRVLNSSSGDTRSQWSLSTTEASWVGTLAKLVLSSLSLLVEAAALLPLSLLRLSSLLFSLFLAMASWLILTVRPVGLLMVTGQGVVMSSEEAVVILVDVDCGLLLLRSCLERRWKMMLRVVVMIKTARRCQEK